jgi:hypothetical protein
MISLKNAAVPNALAALNTLAAERLPVKSALKVRRIYKTLSGQWESVQEVTKQLVDAYGEKDAAGEIVRGETEDSVRIAKEHIARFNTEYSELLNESLEVAEGLTSGDLGEKCEIATAVLLQLGDLFTE